ncbi:MAG: TPM domain-containing protein [Clostridia bacterium]|nr:TPM domain-containing protein [Clostridia bacterium]
MKTKLKLIALITAILLALALPISSALAVVLPDGSYCLDKVGVVSAETKIYIYERNKNLEQNCRGAQMCVVVLDSINGANIEEYAYEVFTSWKIGRSGEDNGVLILMLIGDEDYWIMPGTGLEKDVLTTAMLSSTINAYCEPSFAAGDYDTAIKKTFERINEEICSYYRTNPEGMADMSTVSNEGFVGGGSGSAASNYNSNNSSYTPVASSCNFSDFSAFSRPSCASCALACGSCAGCGSCGGIGGLILAFIVIYVIIQVLRYIGRGSISRVNRAGCTRPRPFNTGFTSARPNYTTHRPPFGGTRSAGNRSGANYSSSGNRHSGSNTGSKAGSGRRTSSSAGFTGGGGGTRGGGAGRTYSSTRSSSTTRSSGSSFKGFSGGGSFKGGGGGTRGGGAGRTKH